MVTRALELNLIFPIFWVFTFSKMGTCLGTFPKSYKNKYIFGYYIKNMFSHSEIVLFCDIIFRVGYSLDKCGCFKKSLIILTLLYLLKTIRFYFQWKFELILLSFNWAKFTKHYLCKVFMNYVKKSDLLGNK